MTLHTNAQLELAFEYVRNTNKNVFLTGKAGSGKTTFLHQIKNDGGKRLSVVAPTGVAAVNAGGMTIHSLFQLPLGYFLPGVQRRDANSQRRFRNAKIRLIRSLDLLVIDEISMVRADLLDAVDDVLRRFRNPKLPFGGVQLLMIGDLHQLPPVIKPDEWEVLRKYYDTTYFFGSRALQRTDYISIELKHIYRQSDPEFIDLLNKVRESRLDRESLRKLNSRFVPDFQAPAGVPYITLTATNASANDINARNLRRLSTPRHVFKAQIAGEFPPTSYPTEETLEFKVGAQVMFIRNDATTRRYFNGKIGQITRIDEDAIYVQCPDDPMEIEVTPVEWQNVKYALNETTKQIDEQILGTFTQYPLKLAWAITIHKSQGLTFERAIIDAQAAFASGQVYVALSRCKSLEGIVLRSPIREASVITDPVVQRFTEEAERNLPTESELQKARRDFQIAALRELFCFDSIQERLGKLQALYSQHSEAIPQARAQLQAIMEKSKADLFDVARKFAPQLSQYFEQDVTPEANAGLQDRLRKASEYFSAKFSDLLRETNTLPTAVDNQAVASAFASQLRSLQLDLHVARACFGACSNGFKTDAYHRTKVNAELDFEKSVEESSREDLAAPADTPHPKLYQQLLEWRQRTAERIDFSLADVFPARILREIASCLPMNEAQLIQIRGIGKMRRRRYGREIIDLVQRYIADENIPLEKISAAKSARRQLRTTDTKTISFELFRSGKTIEEIAASRSLTRGTIEGHLAYFVGIGELDVDTVLNRETVSEIQQFFANNPKLSTADAKSHFGDRYSYGELRLVLSHFSRKRTREQAAMGANITRPRSEVV